MNIQVIGSGSSGNAYLIGDGRTRLLLDCGLPMKQLQAAAGYNVTGLDGCLITHSHKDHCKAHKDLTMMGVDVYAHKDTIREMDGRGYRYKAVSHGKQFSVGTFEIRPFNLVHDVTNTGWLCQSRETGEKLVYVTDTMYIPYKFRGVTHWLVECNNTLEAMEENVEAGTLNRGLKHRIQNSHMSLETLLDVFRANDMSKTEQIYLIHLSDDNSREAEFQDRVARETGAQVIVC